MARASDYFEAARALLAQERGALFKDAGFRVALCYPSPYHVGMSSLGFQAIYRELHGHLGVTAERVFLPDDQEGQAKAKVMPFSLEHQRPLADFHLLAFSVAYELELPGLLAMVSEAGYPVRREDRAADAPLVIAGGPLTFSNPEPLEPFVDVLVQGEAEDTIHELMDVVLGCGSKQEALAVLARRPGFRVPGQSGPQTCFHVAQAEDGRLPARSQVVTPNTELRDMFLIEPERGCSRGCHYCVMRRTTNGGMRTVAPERVLSLIPADALRVGLVGAGVTDHPRIVELLEALVKDGREVGVSSLRADRLTQRLVDALKAGGAQVLTVASDGPSQRLRDLVDRKHSEAQIVAAATFARKAGMKRLKVYNIVGLPTETGDDIDELARFTIELSRIIPIAMGIAPFVAKRNTPLDGAPFAGIGVVEDRLERLRRALKGKAEVRPISARWAWVESMLAQCGPEAGLAAEDAWRAGGSFAAWKKAFAARDCRPFEARRTVDGRHKSTQWPTLGPRGGAVAAGGAEGIETTAHAAKAGPSEWGNLKPQD